MHIGEKNRREKKSNPEFIHPRIYIESCPKGPLQEAGLTYTNSVLFSLKCDTTVFAKNASYGEETAKSLQTQCYHIPRTRCSFPNRFWNLILFVPPWLASNSNSSQQTPLIIIGENLFSLTDFPYTLAYFPQKDKKSVLQLNIV